MKFKTQYRIKLNKHGMLKERLLILLNIPKNENQGQIK